MKWQKFVLSPANFHDAAGKSLPDWKGVKELRLGDKETLRSKDGDTEKKLDLGTDWQGAKPEFQNLRWIPNAKD
jgi:hypothetical protein